MRSGWWSIPSSPPINTTGFGADSGQSLTPASVYTSMATRFLNVILAGKVASLLWLTGACFGVEVL